jgi:hypothetical protein
MRLKSLYEHAVDVVGVGLVEPGEIIEVDRTTGRSLAQSAMWRVTSKDKEDDAEDDAEQEEGEG